jgi:hypothetical protein
VGCPGNRLAHAAEADGIIVYLCYGREDIFAQTRYSILSLLHVCAQAGRYCPIVVYTDRPERFAAFPVEIVALTSDQLEEWLGGADYIHRRKTCVILDALERFHAKVAFIDADTWFAADPARLFARVGPGRAVFHICEAFVASSGTLVDRALVRQLERVPLVLRSNEPVRLGPHTRMWNTGVVGVHPADRERMLDAMALSDAIWRTADPAGAFGAKIHHAEQFATGYAFRGCRISEAADIVYHYWRPRAKRSFGAVIPALIDAWLREPGEETLARAYAARYREQGPRAWIEKARMAARKAALTLNLPIGGQRRSV